MPIPLDDLSPGMWVIICDRDEQSRPNMWGIQPSQTYDGFPLLIEAISLPFLAARRFDGIAVTLDTRTLRFVRATNSYVKTLINGVQGHPDADPDQNSRSLVRRHRRKNRPVKTAPDPRDCNRCGERCVQRQNNRDRLWYYTCELCGFINGPVL